MKSKVKLSSYSLILTLLTLGLFIICIMLSFKHGERFGVGMLILLFILFLLACLYSPLSVSADEESVTVKSPLLRHRLPVSEIQSIDLYQPTMGARRLLGSGGFFGYWGFFSEKDLGKYIAYYGKASDCFLITMNNGRKYVLGCQNPGEMVNYIQSNLSL